MSIATSTRSCAAPPGVRLLVRWCGRSRRCGSASCLGVGATLMLGFTVNWPSALLADAAILFYVFVYTLGSEAPHAVEHRDRRSRRVFPGADRLVGGHRGSRLAGRRPVRCDLRLDAAAFLGAGDEISRRLRGGRRADVAGCRQRAHGRAQDRRLLVPDGRRVAAVGARRPRRAALPRRGWVSVPGFSSRRIGLSARARAGADPKPMRLFHLSITYLTLLFSAIAIGQLIR